MYAIITGASSGIGKEMARCLLSRLDIVLVARSEDKLKKLEKDYNKLSKRHRYNHKVEYFVCDVSNVDECKALYEKYKSKDIQVLINGAGFGALGEFDSISLDREISMVNTNVLGAHVLTKLFLKDMLKRNRGYILNIASSAGYMPGSPYMATYYASKAYILNLTRAIAREKSVMESNVYVGALCPGPVPTGFNEAAGITEQAKGMSPRKVAKYAIHKMYNEHEIILPGIAAKLTYVLRKFSPDELLLNFAGKWQEEKMCPF